MVQIEHGGHKFNVLMGYKLKYPDLIKLILETESMDNQEKQYWFDILPAMTEEQRIKLFNILENERKKLEELDAQFEKEKKEIEAKYSIA